MTSLESTSSGSPPPQGPHLPNIVSLDQARRAEPTVREPDALATLERKNAHEQATQKNEQGALGRWLGSRSEKAGNISFIVIIVCFLFIGIAFLKMDIKSEFDSFMKFC